MDRFKIPIHGQSYLQFFFSTVEMMIMENNLRVFVYAFEIEIPNIEKRN